jgi:hypothetical protein
MVRQDLQGMYDDGIRHPYPSVAALDSTMIEIEVEAGLVGFGEMSPADPADQALQYSRSSVR